MASGSRGQCSLFATCLAVSLYLSYPHLKAGWYWESGGKIPLSRVWKALKKLAAEGIFDEVGTPTFAIDVISQHDMAFALRSLGNPAYARGAHGDQHGCADPRKQKAAAVLSALMATDE